MQQQGMRTGLLVTSETYSRLMAPDDRSTAPLFGDGAAATLLTARDPIYTSGQFTFGTNGAEHHALIAKGTGTRPGPREHLYMDGRGIFSFMMSEIPDDIEKCLAANKLAIDDIDLWVFHQASKYMLDVLAKKMHLPTDKVVVEMADIGNTTSSTIPIALERQVLSGNSNPKRVLISGFGVGLSWASTVLTRTE